MNKKEMKKSVEKRVLKGLKEQIDIDIRWLEKNPDTYGDSSEKQIVNRIADDAIASYYRSRLADKY